MQRPIGIAAVLTAPLALLSMFVWVNAFVNPQMSAYMDYFQLTNATPGPIGITPLGPLGGPQLHVLEQYRSIRPALPSLRQVGRRLESGETVVLLYQGDDTRLTEILVEATGAQPRILPVGQDGEAIGSYGISDLTLLPPAPPASLEAVRRHGSGMERILFMFLGGLLPLAFGAVWYALHRRARQHGERTA